MEAGMNEKDAQILIKYLRREIDKADDAKNELTCGDKERLVNAIEFARIGGYIDGLRWAIDLIERAVGDSE